MAQDGQSVPVVVAALALSAFVSLALASGGREAIDEAHARTAADAAALAGAAEGRSGAERIARANRGRLVGYRQRGPDVVVTVSLGEATVTARAREEDTANQ